MYVSFEKVLSVTQELGNGWGQAEVELGSGDTLWCPGSTRKVIRGRGKYRFTVHPSGVELVKAPPGYRVCPV